jgi:murein L,D-transpeptidase YcbB/YkuD
MHAGATDSDSVRNLQSALAIPTTGDYDSETIAACAAWQRAQGWTGSDADGIAGPATIRKLGLTWVE